MKRNNKTTLSAILLLVLFLGGMYALKYLTTGEKGILEQYADFVINKCASESYRPSCYDKEIPLLVDLKSISMEEAFAVTALIQSKDSEYWYCHVLGHNLSAKETAKDPNNWSKVVARCPVGQCSNGCLHGSFQERYRDEVMSDERIHEIMPELVAVCEDTPTRKFTNLERASCFHGLGHLSMYITGADVLRSLSTCDKVTQQGREPNRRVCYDGVFMQIFQPLEPEDFALVADIAPKTKEESIELCSSFTGIKQGSCHRESWILYKDELQTPQGYESFCASSENDSEKRICYIAITNIIAAKLKLEQDAVEKFCEPLPSSLEEKCYGYSATRMIETDMKLASRAVALCEHAEGIGLGKSCWEELVTFSSFGFDPGSKLFKDFCELLPQPWQKKCFARDVEADGSVSVGKTHTITLTEKGYVPAKISIQLGDTVMWKNETGRPFWPASNLHPSHRDYPEGAFDPREPVAPTATWSFTFDVAGSWKFHDHLSPYYTGMITVVE